MRIPSIPITALVYKNGNVSNEWRIFFEQLINQLQTNVSNQGYISPFHANTDIPKLSVDSLKGGMIYNYEAENMQINTDGNYKPISTYEQLTTSEISSIPSGQRNGRFIYDTDTSELKIGVNDSFLTVTTS